MDATKFKEDLRGFLFKLRDNLMASCELANPDGIDLSQQYFQECYREYLAFKIVVTLFKIDVGKLNDGIVHLLTQIVQEEYQIFHETYIDQGYISFSDWRPDIIYYNKEFGYLHAIREISNCELELSQAIKSHQIFTWLKDFDHIDNEDECYRKYHLFLVEFANVRGAPTPSGVSISIERHEIDFDQMMQVLQCILSMHEELCQIGTAQFSIG